MLIPPESSLAQTSALPQGMIDKLLRDEVSNWTIHGVSLLSGVKWFAVLKAKKELAYLILGCVLDLGHRHVRKL